jgi:hypothetical protein
MVPTELTRVPFLINKFMLGLARYSPGKVKKFIRK